MKNYKWPLMSNNILLKDKNNLIQFIKNTNKFTNGPKVIEFEKKWSKWLGVKYSTFVNSGASANLISINILKELNTNKKEIILPAFTWSSDVVSVINAGFKPIFVDINFENLALNENLVRKKINKNTLAIFITHAMGFNGLTKKFVEFVKKKKDLFNRRCLRVSWCKIRKKKSRDIWRNFKFFILLWSSYDDCRRRNDFN